MSYFNSQEAAARYDAYRPKVHDIVVDWLKDCLGEVRFGNAIDIACGTGDSTLPLTKISDSVLGIDVSNAMLRYAKDREFTVIQCSYNGIDDSRAFDLISTCMAFHWFDPDEALAAYKRISADGAIWIIYNFFFAGHDSSDEFNQWLAEEYMTAYPSPPRNRTHGVLPGNDSELKLLTRQMGIIPITLKVKELVGYLTTQTNVENAVNLGRSYDEIAAELGSQIAQFELSGPYRYNYSYEIYRYAKNQEKLA
jgi:ubiquinone/menaquinone biosynthesis C-methylase UbiE|tara:strand:+ start:1189 stop:1944 length:756 start_codon:yes stop_codon:yes gene_type:complete